MKRDFFRPVLKAISIRATLVTAWSVICTPVAWASPTGPFGAGLPDDGGFSGASLFPKFMGILVSLQLYFNQHLTAAVRAMHHDGSAVWTLLGLSFAYGVVHAAGPGHGKAVVSSYILATRQTLQNGLVLAFVASLAQAASAVALILVASMVLHMTSVSITWATFKFEIISDVLILLLGAWLVWTKIIQPARALNLPFEQVNAFTRPAHAMRAAGRLGRSRFEASGVLESPPASFRLSALSSVRPAPADGDPCDCGGLHMPDAATASGQLDWQKAWTVVASTALRPCTGALIVLVFSMSQGLLFAGIASTLVMGLGTAMTVSVLAVLAVSARRAAFMLTSADSSVGRKIKRVVEVSGALAVFVLGALLLIGNLVLQ